jgi:aconitate hydratase
LSTLNSVCKVLRKRNDESFIFYDVSLLYKKGFSLNTFDELPYCVRILLENIVRNSHFDNEEIQTKESVTALLNGDFDKSISFFPSRILMQDFTGVPALVDFVTLREKLSKNGVPQEKITPSIPVDLVIDHSVIADYFGTRSSLEDNVRKEYERNGERYRFLKWVQKNFSQNTDNKDQFDKNSLRIVPSNTGICHQINLEYFAQVIAQKKTSDGILLYPDTLIGTDSHTTMINGLSVFGFGVGGIEAEAALLGVPLDISVPKVLGIQLTGQLKEGVTATDIVLTLTHILREKKLTSSFIEFFGPAFESMSVFERSTISNMCPEYGAICAFFPINQKTLEYLRLTGRSESLVQRVEWYAKKTRLWYNPDIIPKYEAIIEFNLDSVRPTVSGPKRPQDNILLTGLPQSCSNIELKEVTKPLKSVSESAPFILKNHDIVIAAITSCTNTSNPFVMIQAGLLAKNAYERGLRVKPWVKTSLAPGSRVVTDYLKESGLLYFLEKQGFFLVGYGCTTCIGNSGPLLDEVEKQIKNNNLIVANILSGNRNFEGRIHNLVATNYLASPPLVVAYALAGTMRINLDTQAIGEDEHNNPIFLKDIWPSSDEVSNLMSKHVRRELFIERYKDVLKGDQNFQKLKIPEGSLYSWDPKSVYIQPSPFIESQNQMTSSELDLRILAVLGDSVTTDHISPAGSIMQKSVAGKYLIELGVKPEDFNTFGTYRGNYNVMVRGTLSNVLLENHMISKTLKEHRGGFTYYYKETAQQKENFPELMPIFEAALLYKEKKRALLIIAGKNYGMGSSRDFAAKGVAFLGVRAIIAESFESIHRSNLLGMGVLPFEFVDAPLKVKGDEIVKIQLPEKLAVKQTITAYSDGKPFLLRLRIDTKHELAIFESGGILPYVFNKLLQESS